MVIMENPIEIDDLEVPLIFGNIHLAPTSEAGRPVAFPDEAAMRPEFRWRKCVSIRTVDGRNLWNNMRKAGMSLWISYGYPNT